MNMFDRCHIAPSYRRRASQSWATSMTLLVDLLRGNGKHRYLRTIALPRLSRCLYPWFFSGVAEPFQYVPLVLADATHVSARHIGKYCPSVRIVISDICFSRRASAALPLVICCIISSSFFILEELSVSIS